MIKRLLELPKEYSFFLFGPRSCGKSTLIKKRFSQDRSLLIDLLDIHQEARYLRDPQSLKAEVLALSDRITHVLIDEIQKIPELLSVVHALIEETDKYFVLTGSSARQLKVKHADMLAGRAFVKNLHPYSYVELGSAFDFQQALAYGLLPMISNFSSNVDRADYLRAYAHTYLKEEVWAEHLVRRLEPFQYFLEVAAQTNGQIVNASNIAKDVGVDDKTIHTYFAILQDTLLGFYLPGFKHSFRKRITQKPKFYFFDVGVLRALQRTLSQEVVPGTYEYGKLFEHFIIVECIKLASYYYPDYRFSHLRVADHCEIDLVVERPGQPLLFIEIKSANQIREDQLKHLKSMGQDLGAEVECYCLADVPRRLKYDNIHVLPWQEGVRALFTVD